MTLFTLLRHQWKESMRSSFWQRSIIINIMLAILSLYLITVGIALGYMADEIVKNIYKSREVTQAFTGLMFYFFIFDLLMRFMIQKLPVVSVLPYLTLPVRKRTLLHYPLLKTLPGFFNIFSLLLLLPFFFKVVIDVRTPYEASAWLVTMLSLILLNNFLAFTLKKYMAGRPLIIVILMSSLSALFILDIKGVIAASDMFADFFSITGSIPAGILIGPALAALSYLLAFNMLKRNSYIEDNNTRRARVTSGFSFLSRYGGMGSLMQNELRLIFRNKRPKAMIWFSAIFMLYGFIFYADDNTGKDFYLLFAGLFLTTAASITYGQLVFSWESSYFDFISASRISPYTYIRSKYLLFAAFNLIGFVLTLPYGFISAKIILINTVMFIYNTGFSLYLLFLFGAFNYKCIDLGKSQFMNYEGTNLMQFLMTIPFFGVPMAVVLVLKIFFPPATGYIVLLILGLCGIIFNDYIIRLLVRLFLRNRYRMAEGYRKNQ